LFLVTPLLRYQMQMCINIIRHTSFTIQLALTAENRTSKQNNRGGLLTIAELFYIP